MARSGKPHNNRSLESYEHRDKQRLNTPLAASLTPHTDPDVPPKKTTYAYDLHFDPQLVSAGKAQHTANPRETPPSLSDAETIDDVKEKQHTTRLLLRLAESRDALRAITNFGYNHWIVTFSGGKDSTATLTIALETALSLSQQLQRIDIVYSDTQIEIPSIQQYAIRFLEYLKRFPRLASLPLQFHVVRPTIENSFWFCLLGKGYPPPHQRFRWCTRRLKIEPVENALKSFVCPGKTVILTGVRFGESPSRNARLLKSCGRGGECGQGAWLDYSSRLKAAYLAPIAHWNECDVWDFLHFHAPGLGYPTSYLEESVYNGRGTRFGCWMCTVVRQDKAMEKITSLPEWAHLKPLLDFRQRVKELTGSLGSRVLRHNGKPGKLTLATRQQLLNELLKLQERLGMLVVSPDQILAIQEYWKKEIIK